MLSACFLTSCADTKVQGGATSDELCRQWGGSLPTRSVADTAQTSDEIQVAYATFALACPDRAWMIP
jgi:hypothetical protein